MDVVAIGESMVALVNKPAGYIRHADGFKPFVAGAETNTLIGLSRLGHKTAWISALGKDELGEFILHKVRAEQVDTASVSTTGDRTGVFFKQISPDGSVDVTYYRENSAASHMTLDDIDMDKINGAKVLYITGITLSLSGQTKEMLFNVVKALNEDVKVVFDPNIRLKMWTEAEARKTILELLPHVDYLIAGKQEVDILLGHQDFDAAMDKFKGFGCANIIIKLGREGALYDMDGVRGRVDNPKQFEEIDPVGAGDAFAAGVVSGILEDREPEGMIRTACFLGGYITQFIGDYQGFPSRDKIEAMIDAGEDEKVKR